MEDEFFKQAIILEAEARKDGIQCLATGIAVEREGKILIVVRSDEEEALQGYAELPGGAVEVGETLFQGLSRELAEETGLQCGRILRYLGSFDYRSMPTDVLVRQFNYAVEADGDVVLNPAEHKTYFWLQSDNLALLDAQTVSDEMKKIILRALQK